MGWTWYHCAARKANGKPDAKAELDGIFSGTRNEVLRSVVVGSTYYAAVKNTAAGEVWGAVIRFSVDSRSHYDFGYKEMEEDMGPCYYDCPESILDMLSPTDHPWAQKWREKCREAAAEKKWFKQLADGDAVNWTVPHDHFTHIREGDIVKLVKAPLNPGASRSKKVWKLSVDGRVYHMDRAQVKKADTCTA